jgi:ABC-type glycerol-3-phosphate transport system substrate-binding protein
MWRRVILLAAVLLAACASSETAEPTTDATQPSTLAPTLTPAPNTTPTLAPAEQRVDVWLVDTFAPSGQVPVVLLEQFDAFRAEHPDITVNLRVKPVEGTSSMLAVLRSTASVAPDALPDLVLLSRPDLASAHNDGLVQSLGEQLPDDLFPVAREVATLDDAVYGVPYLLDTRHLIYRPDVFDETPTQFDDLLRSSTPYLLDTGVAETVLGQYLAGGGGLLDEDGQAALNLEVAQDVLRFYGAMTDVGLIHSGTLEYRSTQERLDAFLTGKAALMSISASEYLSLQSELEGAPVAVVPARGGPSVVVVDGWSWAVIVTDRGRAALVQALLDWLMRPENHGAFARAVNMLPAQRQALGVWGEDGYTTFIESVLGSGDAVPKPARVAELAAMRALQDAMRSVLLRERSAEQAAQWAVQVAAGDE